MCHAIGEMRHIIQDSNSLKEELLRKMTLLKVMIDVQYRDSGMIIDKISEWKSFTVCRKF